MQFNNIILFLNLGSGEIFLVVMFILIFFGSKKLPELARGLGRGMREMKNAAAEIQREIEIGAAEVQRDANIKDVLDETEKAANVLESGVNDALNTEVTGTTDVPEQVITQEETPPQNELQEPDKDNPLVPPQSIIRK
jgi:sec-independent protein translocase protein TatA